MRVALWLPLFVAIAGSTVEALPARADPPTSDASDARATTALPASTATAPSATSAAQFTAVTVAPSATASPAVSSDPIQAARSRSRTIGLGVGAAGLVVLTAGAVFGILTIKAKSDYQQYCGSNAGLPYPDVCNPPGVIGYNDAVNKARASTLLFILGGTVLVAGAIAFFTAPRAQGAPAVGIGPGGVALRWVF